MEKKLQLFRDKYDRLGDAVITNISYSYENERNIEIQMKCFQKDFKDFEWRELNLHLLGVNEFIFIEKKGSAENNVIYSTVISIYNGKYVFDFSPYSPDSSTIEEYRKSDFLVICNDFKIIT